MNEAVVGAPERGALPPRLSTHRTSRHHTDSAGPTRNEIIVATGIKLRNSGV